MTKQQRFVRPSIDQWLSLPNCIVQYNVADCAELTEQQIVPVEDVPEYDSI